MTRLPHALADHTKPGPVLRARRGVLSGSSGLAGVVALGLAASLSFGATAQAQTLPTGGTVVAGDATIATAPGAMTINQSTQNTAINWQTFSIGAGGSVVFVQPNGQSVALNRVTGAEASSIFGSLTANGQVFLVNPNGVLFAPGSQVNVGGLVASTLGITDVDFMAGDYRFTGGGSGAVLNQGAIVADGGYVALLGGQVSNEGVIQASLGTIALAVGEAVTLDVAGDGLLNVVVDRGAANALVQNGGMLQADGGRVVMTADGAGALLRTVVNNTGVIQARTIGGSDGLIQLLGDASSGTVNVGALGVLDASAPGGGDGGSIETAAATVNVAAGASITAAAPGGDAGTWHSDQHDFTIGAGGNISGATLSAQLVTTNVVISTLNGAGAPGEGDIIVNDAIAWTASSTPTTLTLNANRDVNINNAISATNGNLVVCCGRDVNVEGALTTVNGSILLEGGRNVNVFHAITTTDGNIALCAGHDVHIDAAITLTDGSTIVAQSLGLPVGLTLIAGAAGTGPGVGGGTIIFAPLAPQVTVTDAPATINYNPVSYAAPSNFLPEFTLTEGAALTQRMLLFPDGGRVENGTRATTLNGFRTTAVSGLPSGVILVAGPGATATFDSAAPGADVGITYSGYTLAGASADQYALASSCCTPTFRTRGTIAAAPVIPPVVPPVAPPVVPPVIPPVVPPVTPTGPTPFLPYPVTTWPIATTASGLDLVTIDNGVRMPVYEAAPVAPPVPEMVESLPQPARIIPPPPPVPVYPRKQDRN